MKRNRMLMLLINILQSLVFYGPISTLYRESRGIDMSKIFIIESVYLAVTLVCEIPWGVVADRIGYRRTLIISNILFFVSKIVFLYAYDFFMFALERVLLGIAISGISGCDSAILYESLEDEDAQVFFGRYYASGTAAFVAASTVGSLLAQVSYDMTAILTSIVYLAAAVLSFFLIEPPKENAECGPFRYQMEGAFKYLKGHMGIVFLSLLGGLLGVIIQALVFLNQPQFIKCGIKVEYFGIIISMLEIVKSSSAKTHCLTQRVGESPVLVTVPLVIGISYLMLTGVDSPVATILLMAAILGSYALLGPVMTDVLNRDIRSGRATILSLYSWIGSIAGIAVNPIIGSISNRSVERSFGFLGTVAVLISIGIFIVLRRNPIAKSKAARNHNII